MIEIPRAALTADQLARYAQFFSFGTNDLTQTTYAISRDDAEKGFLMEYLEKKILEENPFASIDEEGVGKLMAMAVELGRKHAPGHGDRHLRRARRRPEVGRLLPPHRPQLRLLLALPRPHRPPRCGAGGAQGEGLQGEVNRRGRRLEFPAG